MPTVLSSYKLKIANNLSLSLF